MLFCTGFLMSHVSVDTCTQVFNATVLCQKDHPIKPALTFHLTTNLIPPWQCLCCHFQKEKKGHLDLIPCDVLPTTVTLPSNVPENKSATDSIKRRGVFLPTPSSAARKKVLLKVPRLEVTAARRQSLPVLGVPDVPCTPEPFLTLRRATPF